MKNKFDHCFIHQLLFMKYKHLINVQNKYNITTNITIHSKITVKNNIHESLKSQLKTISTVQYPRWNESHDSQFTVKSQLKTIFTVQYLMQSQFSILDSSVPSKITTQYP